jgi:DNA polymerase delta subunit 1
MKFAVKSATCLGCKTPLKKGSRSASLSLFPLSLEQSLTIARTDQAVCDNCRGRTAELHSRQVRFIPLRFRYSPAT